MKKIISLLCACAVAGIPPVALAEEELTIATSGGAYQSALSKGIFQPGAKALGIAIKEVTFGGVSDLRSKVRANAVEWDIVVGGANRAARAAEEGLLEPLDYGMIDVSDFYPGLYLPHCVGNDVFSVVMAWNTDTYGDNGPKNWADFWDAEKFPGKRSYRNKVAGALEPALLADGVPPEEVYKVLSTEAGIERALDKIRELKPHIAVWWSSGAQHAQLMKDGEVDMTTGWNGRFDVAIADGAKADYTFNQGLLSFDCHSIPKGAPNKDLAMKMLAEITKPKYQAEFVKYITYGPTNKKAYDLGTINETVAKKLPSHPDNVPTQLQVDLEWYGKYEKDASAAYQDMLTE
ncbi:MAG: ABC transporter substrate-binding protein [Gammaproteobacteria bacterium]